MTLKISLHILELVDKILHFFRLKPSYREGVLKIGDPAPDFNLPGVDGKDYGLKDFKDKKIVIVMFSCNHCPYVKAYEDRFVELQRDYEGKGVVLIAINPNDDKKYREDSFESMKIRAREKSFNFPYLRDENQSVARAYGAERTPEVFVLDEKRTLRYHGRIDDNVYDSGQVRQHYVRDALDSLFRGEKVPLEDTDPVGCTVKWK
jgi:peroxiredoxin